MTQPSAKILSRLNELNMDVWADVLAEMELDELLELIHVSLHTLALKSPDAEAILTSLRQMKKLDGDESIEVMECYSNALRALARFIDFVVKES